MKTPEEIVTLKVERQTLQDPALDVMRQIRDANNGDMVIPVPEMERNERSSVANIINTGIEKTGMKIAAVTPNLWFPALEPGKRSSEKKAATRRRAALAWQERNRLGLKNRRRGRHLAGYGATAVILRPDWDLQCARWEVRDPLTAYPAPSADPDDLTPTDVIFGYQRSLAWLTKNYPDETARLSRGKAGPNDRFDILEYTDADETVLIVVGKADDTPTWQGRVTTGSQIVELRRTPNRTGMCLAVMPRRITLDRVMGQFDQLLGMQMMQGKLNALEYIAIKKSVFPDMFLVSRPNEEARFVAGPFEGSSGMYNIVAGGQPEPITWQPGVQTNTMIDRLERNQRVTGAVAPEMGGESATNVRTGKRGDAILAEVVDPVAQEAQEILAASMQEELRRAIAIDKAYWGSTKKSFYLTDKGKAATVDYVPNEIFETDYCSVTFPMAGTDTNGLIVGAGQRIGLGTLSKRGFMELDPLISDPEREMDRVVTEALDAALLSSVQSQAQSGALPLPDVARIRELVGTDQMSLVDAIQKAQSEAQNRQATPTPNPAETQPGLAQPGMGAEAPPDASLVNPPSQNLDNLSNLLGSLQRSGRPTRPSRPVVAG